MHMQQRLSKLANTASAGLALFVILTAAIPAFGGLIANGSFESTTLTASGQVHFKGDVSGWENDPSVPLGFLYFPGTSDDTLSDQFSGGFRLWQGITDTIPSTSPDGGNFLVFDGAASYRGGISQNVSGLEVGVQYNLTFYQAAGQQRGFSGDTQEWWHVTFGGESADSTVQSNPSHDFQPWTLQTMTFTPTSAGQVLTFLSEGTPNGLPPMAMLDGISLARASQNAGTPEPSTLAAAFLGLSAWAASRRLRKRA